MRGKWVSKLFPDPAICTLLSDLLARMTWRSWGSGKGEGVGEKVKRKTGKGKVGKGKVVNGKAGRWKRVNGKKWVRYGNVKK